MSTSAKTTSEHDAIAETINRYVEGGRSGRGDDMRAAFHPDATIFGYIGDELFSGPIQKLFDWNDQNGLATELQARIAGIDIEGNGIRRATCPYRGRSLGGTRAGSDCSTTRCRGTILPAASAARDPKPATVPSE